MKNIFIISLLVLLLWYSHHNKQTDTIINNPPTYPILETGMGFNKNVLGAVAFRACQRVTRRDNDGQLTYTRSCNFDTAGGNFAFGGIIPDTTGHGNWDMGLGGCALNLFGDTALRDTDTCPIGAFTTNAKPHPVPIGWQAFGGSTNKNTPDSIYDCRENKWKVIKDPKIYDLYKFGAVDGCDNTVAYEKMIECEFTDTVKSNQWWGYNDVGKHNLAAFAKHFYNNGLDSASAWRQKQIEQAMNGAKNIYFSYSKEKIYGIGGDSCSMRIDTEISVFEEPIPTELNSKIDSLVDNYYKQHKGYRR